MIAPINDVQPRLRFNDGMFWRKNNSITKHNTTVDLINNGLSEIKGNTPGDRITPREQDLNVCGCSEEKAV